MTMATDYNNRLITPDLEKAMKDYPLYSSAVHVGTFLKDSESTTILFFSASS